MQVNERKLAILGKIFNLFKFRIPCSIRELFHPMPSKLKNLILWLIVFSPAIVTAILMSLKAVDVGCWDDWEMAWVVAKWHDGTLTFADLYAAQIQHRIVFPRLINIALTYLSGGDFRAQQWFTYALFALNSVMIWALLRRTLGQSPWRWPLMLAFNLLIFCPMHYQILFWGACFWTTMPLPCLLASLLVLGKDKWPVWLRFTLTVILAEIATHSFGHGMAAWPLMFGYFLVDSSLGSLRKRIAYSAIWLVIAGITLKFYFTDFINVAYHAYNLKPGDHAMKGATSLMQGDNLVMAVRFFLGYVGTWFARNPFSEHPLEASKLLGLITMVLFTFIALASMIGRIAKENWHRTLPWLAIAAYAIGVGLMVSKRGGDIGEHRAVTPRYLAVSEYLLISGMTLAAIIGSAYAARLQKKGSSYSQAPTLIGTCLLTAFIVLQIPVWQYGLHLTDVWYKARKQSAAVFLYLPHLTEQGKLLSMKTLCKSSDYCLKGAESLDKINLLKFRPLETPELKYFDRAKKPLAAEKASLGSATFGPDGVLSLKGEARFNVGQPADAILISHGDQVISLGQSAPIHLLRIFGLDYEFSNYEDITVSSMYPWEATLTLPASLPEDVTLDLWALDVMKGKIAKLKTSLRINKATGKVEMVEDTN
jgi:hypothetical protein